MFNQNFKIIFQMSQPAKIPQKWPNTNNGPMDVRFQMRLAQTVWAFIFLEKSNKNDGKIFQNFLKRLHNGFCLIFSGIRNLIGLGLSHLKPDIQMYILSTKTFF